MPEKACAGSRWNRAAHGSASHPGQKGLEACHASLHQAGILTLQLARHDQDGLHGPHPEVVVVLSANVDSQLRHLFGELFTGEAVPAESSTAPVSLGAQVHHLPG